ncbi:fungal-specific transcription factor domain-containing protein [Pseudomassariella vexata]|uniref:Fungal-specific transcription factor domain-domain-containing protein n=1 Tax=Pseudomassariella vexata TaxID=1141098 RepID=A0A1Y2D9H9_9PEZI|nr:fungal-specific transcription factor domain-containing protein [Pseudomassariella vexata]ORY55922.1 fungal-specific transcription factor domain-domain-containing protein [Pseudomassariella vexata]
MPPGRPPKRPGEPDDVDSPDSNSQGKLKLPRLDRGGAPNDFSSVVKSKLQSYTRTGQACDRCKVRKIRCDALPEGCSHCLNQNLECYVTDRVTGRTERRGYMQELEREKMDMLNHIRELEKLLEGNGIEVKPWNWSAYPQNFPPNVTYDSIGNPVQEASAAGKEQWTQMGNSVWVKNHQPKTQFSSISRSTLEPRPADVHLGVGVDQSPLSSIKGTALSILGSTIDIGSFDTPDADEPVPGAQAKSPLYNKSIQACLQSITNVNPQLHVDYPPKTDAFTYAEWYFLMIHPFTPVLHKPSFMNLLARLYDDPSFKPSVAEVVMIHMVFASIYLQYGIRNRENPEQRVRLNDLSNQHYHFALSKWFDLATSRTFADLQSLTIIALHTRCFPKPDCCSMLITYCLSFATELGLHRAVKKPGEGTNLENEMRKRVFWTILCIAVTLNGRTGRPMPIRLQEIDCDFPELIPDELLSKDGVDTSTTGKCIYEVGVAGFKISAILLDIFANLYCARRDYADYVNIVEELEARIRRWEEDFAELLKSTESDNPVLPLYAEGMIHVVQLCLRHPSVAMTNDPKVMAENTRSCEQTAKAMLNNVYRLYKLKSLDTTWYALAVWVAAIFSQLVACWERRHETTHEEVEELRFDMNKWLAILAEGGSLMGSGSGPRDAVSVIVDRTIAWIERDRQQPKLTAPVPQVSQDMLKQSPQPSSYATLANAPGNATASHNGADSGSAPAPGPPRNSSNTNSYYTETGPEPATYPLPYSDPNANPANNLPYDPNTENQYNLYAQAASQVPTAHMQAAPEPQAPAQTQAQPQTQVPDHNNPLSTFAAQATQMAQPDMTSLWRQPAPGTTSSSGGNTWQDWTAAVVDNQDRYSANALMSLGGSNRPAVNVTEGAEGMGMGVNGGSMNVNGVNGAPVTTSSANMQWPLLIFHDETDVGNA